jgi:hypothetical protein
MLIRADVYAQNQTAAACVAAARWMDTTHRREAQGVG